MISNEVTRRAKRRIPRWVWLLAAVILIPAQFYWVKYYWFDRPAGESHLARYPELASADPRICAALRRALKKPNYLFRDHLEALDFRPLERILQKAGERGPRAILKVMVDQAPRPDGVMSRGHPDWDRDFQPVAMWLRDHAPIDLDSLLVRVARDRDFHYGMRTRAVTALCRPESAAHVGALAKIALDPDEPNWLRSDIVLRLPRMEVPLHAHLRPLLYQPFHCLDQDAAIAVTLADEPEAPTLLVEAVRTDSLNHSTNGVLLVDAIRKLIGRDRDVLARAAQVRKFHSRDLTGVGGEQQQIAAHDALVDALNRWLAAHPEARATRFERERAAYLNSDARRRELAIRRFEDILETDDKDLDLGAATIWCAQPEATPEARYWRLHHLEYLHRLSLLLADDIRDLQEPEAIIGAICRRLFPQGQRGTSWSWEGDRPSTLQVVLRNQEGNCVGYSLLLLAMGERLGLPLHGVRSPEHLFVRWDDGKTRRNIETTAGGKALTDADYHTWGPTTRPITPEDLAAGRYLRNLTRKQVIASLLNNLAYIHLNSANLKPGPWRYERAHACASRAIRLDPEFASAYIHRAGAAIRLGVVDRSPILRDIETALRLDQQSIRAHVMAGWQYTELEQFQQALQHFERALAADPKAGGARLGKIKILLALDRVNEALTQADSLDAELARTHDARWLRLVALIRLRDSRWRHEYERVLEGERSLPAARHLLVAGALLRHETDAAPEPKLALEVLDRIPDHGLAEGDDEGSVVRKVDDGVIYTVTKKELRCIQRMRDDLRAQAEALLAAPKDAGAGDD